jgi:hypothetical protein
MPVNMFCIAPALLDKVQFAVKFWQENNLNPTRGSARLKMWSIDR